MTLIWVIYHGDHLTPKVGELGGLFDETQRWSSGMGHGRRFDGSFYATGPTVPGCSSASAQHVPSPTVLIRTSTLNHAHVPGPRKITSCLELPHCTERIIKLTLVRKLWQSPVLMGSSTCSGFTKGYAPISSSGLKIPRSHIPALRHSLLRGIAFR